MRHTVMINFRQTVYTLAISAVMIALTAIVFSRISVWETWQPATCLESGCFCEAVQGLNSVRQPVNTWSSFAFVIVGIWIVSGALLGVARSPYTRFHAYGVGLSSIVIGLGSAFYHASLTFTGQFFDIFGMLLLTAFMLLYALQRLRQWSNLQTVVIYIVFNAIVSVVQIVVPETRRYLFAAVLLVAIAVEIAYRRKLMPVIQTKWFNLGLALFAVAFAVWWLDNSGIVCSPTSFLQGHAVWHVIGAVAVLCLNRYYLSEVP